LSRQEIEVLTAISMGYTEGQIAAMLGITPGTVRDHIGAIAVKLGAGNRCHMVRLGFTQGYLRLDMESLARKPLRRAA
jgi:DNA-binding NarL/FixJ family response regulator